MNGLVSFADAGFRGSKSHTSISIHILIVSLVDDLEPIYLSQ